MGNKIKIELDPANPPQPGFVFDDGGFVYTLKSAKPHRNLAGDASLITVWDCICAEDGAHFEAKRGCKIYNFPRRCEAHNIGWTKAYPWGAPRPENAPSAAGNGAAAVKGFLDRFGEAMDRGEIEGVKGVAGERLYEALTDFYEREFGVDLTA
jgi:hypothetical protein